MGFRRSILLLIFIVTVSVLHLGISTKNINLKYEVEALKRTFNKLRTEIRHLNSLAARRGDLNRIESIATGKLHMIRPADVNYIRQATSEVSR